VISEFGAAGRYLAGVVDCTVEGEGVGALRTLTSADGSAIVERLEALDEVTYRLSYALLTDTPFADCLNSLALRDLGLHQSDGLLAVLIAISDTSNYPFNVYRL